MFIIWFSTNCLLGTVLKFVIQFGKKLIQIINSFCYLITKYIKNKLM